MMNSAGVCGMTPQKLRKKMSSEMGRGSLRKTISLILCFSAASSTL